MTGIVSDDFQVCFPIYPMGSPYRFGRGVPHDPRMMVGRLPRIVSIMVATVVVDDADGWDAGSRTLMFDGLRSLLDRFRLYSGGRTRALVDDAVRAFALSSYRDGGRMVRVCDGMLLDDGVPAGERWLRFSPRTVELVMSDHHPFPAGSLDAVGGHCAALDLLTVAACFSPADSRPLLVPYELLRMMLPGNAVRMTRPDDLARMCRLASSAQSWWTFHARQRGLLIHRSDRWTDGMEPVMLTGDDVFHAGASMPVSRSV